jgi:hypothetical protein
MKRIAVPFVRYLFFITAAVLTALSAGTFMRINNNPSMKILYAIYAVLMLGDALAMLFCGLYLKSQPKTVYGISVIVLSLNIVLTVFDQFGMADLLFSLLNLATLIPLLLFRKEFLPL